MTHSHNPPITALLLTLGLATLACADEEPEPETDTQPSVDIETNPDVDLSQYNSFSVVDPKLSTDDDPPPKFSEFQATIEDAVTAELTGKGLSRNDEDPQLWVNPHVRIDEVSDPQSFYTGYWGWYYGYEYLWTVDLDYREGTLVLDVIDKRDPSDVADDVLVYRGTAEGLLAEDHEVVELQIRNAVHEIFAQWPERGPSS